jgi:hypothetical protein
MQGKLSCRGQTFFITFFILFNETKPNVERTTFPRATTSVTANEPPAARYLSLTLITKSGDQCPVEIFMQNYDIAPRNVMGAWQGRQEG